jgi:hypothetical protein
MERQLAAILYADVAGYSRLTGLNEEETHRKLDAGLNLLTDVIAAHDWPKMRAWSSGLASTWAKSYTTGTIYMVKASIWQRGFKSWLSQAAYVYLARHTSRLGETVSTHSRTLAITRSRI